MFILYTLVQSLVRTDLGNKPALWTRDVRLIVCVRFFTVEIMIRWEKECEEFTKFSAVYTVLFQHKGNTVIKTSLFTIV